MVGNPSAAVAESKQLATDLMEHMRVQAEKKKAGKKPTKADTDREQELTAALEAAQARRAADDCRHRVAVAA